ncbi:MAG: phosphate regulon sensor histidine kinase PhoR [Gammaproteobacteria bacterium]|nr:phosphate regulon sensor histidine kinase PhoR [Gammaproteobacteria bacterium]
MFKEWNLELNQFLILLAIGAFGGWATGYPGWSIALVSVTYSFWMLFRARDLIRWLRSGNDADAPEGSGLWGALYDHLFQQQKQQRLQINNLHSIIARAQQSTNAIRDAVIVVDRYGNLEWWNEAGSHWLGLKTSTDQGQPITNLLRDPRFVRFFNRGQFDGTLEIPAVLHPGVVLQYQVTAFGDGERLLVVRDVTRLHNLEQMRKDFVANVSHELRTPLTVIKGYLETFLDVMSDSNPQLKRGLGQMQLQAQRMEMLVNDLLLLSRLETENTAQPMKPVQVGRLLKQVFSDAQALNGDKRHNIQLDLDESLVIFGDENELRSAFSNLVVNAVKYTPEQGNILIRWWADPDGAHMAVQDDGVGIDAKHIPRLTERFYRADQSRHAKTGGTGLGLAIVKHVLIHHGAHLDIDSTPGEGSTFTCHFPRKNIVDAQTTSRSAAC